MTLVHQLKVTLRGIRPLIWRRLLVLDSTTLASLHDVVQFAMGWDDCHMHEFTINEERFGTPKDPADQVPGFPRKRIRDEERARLFNVLGRVGMRAVYTYDFGDTWEHNIKVEKIMPAEPGKKYPVCIGGKRNCPLEDCGGPYGYMNIMDVLANPDDEEHEELLEWIGEGYDPAHFSVEEVNARLVWMARTPKTGSQGKRAKKRAGKKARSRRRTS